MRKYTYLLLGIYFTLSGTFLLSLLYRLIRLYMYTFYCQSPPPFTLLMHNEFCGVVLYNKNNLHRKRYIDGQELLEHLLGSSHVLMLSFFF